jgi:hypothetical protein
MSEMGLGRARRAVQKHFDPFRASSQKPVINTASQANIPSNNARHIDDNDSQAMAHIFRRDRFEHPFHLRR